MGGKIGGFQVDAPPPPHHSQEPPSLGTEKLGFLWILLWFVTKFTLQDVAGGFKQQPMITDKRIQFMASTASSWWVAHTVYGYFNDWSDVLFLGGKSKVFFFKSCSVQCFPSWKSIITCASICVLIFFKIYYCNMYFFVILMFIYFLNIIFNYLKLWWDIGDSTNT